MISFLFSFLKLLILQQQQQQFRQLLQSTRQVFIKIKLEIKYNSKIINYLILTDFNYIGCYPGGSLILGAFSFDLLGCGLTQTKLSNFNSNISYEWPQLNNAYLIMLNTGMTIEKCIDICLTNGFVYAGLEWRLFQYLNINI